MLPAVLALVGAIVYGAADFLGGLAAKRLRSTVVTAVTAVGGLIVLLVAYPVMGGAWTGADVAWGALAGLFGAFAVVLLYACLAIGPMSILSPLTAVVSAIAPILWGLLIGGETLSPIGYAGLGVALVAVVLVGFIPGEKTVRPSPRGVLMAVGAGIAIGAFLIVLDQTGPSSGLVPLMVGRTVNVLLMGGFVAMTAIVAVRSGRPAASVLIPNMPAVGITPEGRADVAHTTGPAPRSRRSAWVIALAGGAVDAAANILLLLALRQGDLSIVSALTAMYPAGTIILAGVVLRERVAGVQWAGLVLALVAGGMLALA